MQALTPVATVEFFALKHLRNHPYMFSGGNRSNRRTDIRNFLFYQCKLNQEATTVLNPPALLAG